MTAPRAREQAGPPAPPEHRPPRRGGGPSREDRAPRTLVRTLTRLAAMPPLLALLGALVLPQAQAQETITLVSNLHVTASTRQIVSTSITLRQRFTTGSYPSGYAITKLKIDSFQLNSNDNSRIRLYSDSAGSLGSSLHTFSAPSSFVFSGDNTFTLSSVTLTPDTSYWLVFEARASIGMGWRIGRTTHGGENTYNNESWSIDDSYDLVENGVVSTKNYSLIFRLQGTVTNTAATGTPTISGTAHSGEELRAHTGSVADANGIDRKRYEWFRIASDDTETPIIGSGSSRYRLTGFDAGKKVKVRLYFEDKAGYDEERFSAAFPASGTIGNTVPTASDGLITIDEDVPYAFRAADFNLQDADRGNSLGSVKIVSLPAKGSLTNGGTAVTVGQVIPREDIFQKFAYTPLENENGDDYTSFQFKVSDGGAESANAYTLTIHVAPVNDPATAASNAIGVGGGDAYVGIKLFSQFIKSSITDIEGLTSPDFQYQWIRVTIDAEGNVVSKQDIPRATKSKYKLKQADLGKKVQYRLSFYDDTGNLETLESSLFPISRNETVAWLPLFIGLRLYDVIERENGILNSRIILRSTYDFYMSSRDMRDNALTVDNGSIVKVKRLDHKRRFVNGKLRPVGKEWRIEVAPTNPSEIVTVTHTGRDCDERGAICSLQGLEYLEDPDPLQLRSDIDNAEPLSVSIKDTTADEGDLMLFDLILSRGTRNIVKVVTQITREGTATAGDDFKPVEHTVIFDKTRDLDGVNVTEKLTKQVGIKIHEDAHGDDGETIVVKIVKAEVVVNGRRRTPIPIGDDKATGTITDVAPGSVTLPTLSVDDATAEEGTDDTVDFKVSLSQASTEIVRVDYITWSGTARKGRDFRGVFSTLVFLSGETEKTISVSIIDDAIDEGNETFILLLRNPSKATISDGEAIGTITNDDPLQQAWLARFGRTVATHVTDAVGDRLRGTPGQDSHLTVGGYRLPLGQRATDGKPGAEADKDSSSLEALVTGLAGVLGLGPGQAGGTGAEPGGGLGGASWPDSGRDPRLGPSQSVNLDLRRLLLGSSFRLALGGDDAGASRLRLTAWGRVAGTTFDGRDGDLSLDGDVLTGTVGVDGEWDRLLAGLAVAHSRGDGSYTMPVTGGQDRGDLEQTLTSIHPYLRYAVTDRLAVWGLFGYGWGELDLEPDTDDTMETDTTLVMGAFGGRGILLAAPESGGFQLATRTDAMLTRTSSDAVQTVDGNMASGDAEAHRLRLVLEGSRPVTWAEGRRLTPTMEVGLRHDWGDAETGFGLELGGRVQYADPALGLTIDATVRGLLAHEDDDYQEWGASGTVRIAPGATGQGLSLTLAPAWGATASGVNGLWSRQTTAGLAPQGTRQTPAGRLNAEVGYGFAPFDTGLLTPYAGTVLTEGAARTYRLGTRLRMTGGPATGLSLNLEGTRQDPVGQQPPNQGLRLQATWGF